MRLQAHDLSYVFGKNFFDDDGFQNMFFYQTTLDTLDSKKRKVLIIFSVGNQRGCTLLNLSYHILLSCLFGATNIVNDNDR